MNSHDQTWNHFSNCVDHLCYFCFVFVMLSLTQYMAYIAGKNLGETPFCVANEAWSTHKDHVSKCNFSEHGLVAYQIKGNRECNNMVANVLPVDPPPPTLGWGQGQNLTFSEHGHVAYHFK